MRQFRFKVSSNLVLKIERDNSITANEIVDQLFNYSGFTVKDENSSKSISNLLYLGNEIKAAYYDCLTGEILLNVEEDE